MKYKDSNDSDLETYKDATYKTIIIKISDKNTMVLLQNNLPLEVEFALLNGFRAKISAIQ